MTGKWDGMLETQWSLVAMEKSAMGGFHFDFRHLFSRPSGRRVLFYFGMALWQA